MKALEILREIKNTYNEFVVIGFTKKSINIDEAIKELEELNNRSCESCKCWDSVENSKLKTISFCRFLNTGTKNSFDCSEYEKKDSE